MSQPRRRRIKDVDQKKTEQEEKATFKPAEEEQIRLGADKFWKRWYFWATHSRLPPMSDAAKTIARHLPNVLTYFSHRVSNAVAEGLNSKIATVQKRACGYRNPEHFKIAVYFHCGGLSLWPHRWMTH